MSIQFVINGHRINLRSIHDDIDPQTQMMWIYPTDISTVLQNVTGKVNAGSTTGFAAELNFASTAGRMRIFEKFDVADTEYITSDDPFTQDEWQFFAFILDRTTAPKGAIYRGTRTVSAVESIYGTSTDGSTTALVNQPNDAFLGNHADVVTEEFHGRIHNYIHVNRRLSIGEIIHWQYAGVPVTGMLRYFPGLGYHGTGAGSIKDYSGTGLLESTTGTVTVADPAPLGPVFGADDASMYLTPAPAAGRIMSSLVDAGGLAASGGLAGKGGGLAA